MTRFEEVEADGKDEEIDGIETGCTEICCAEPERVCDPEPRVCGKMAFFE